MSVPSVDQDRATLQGKEQDTAHMVQGPDMSPPRSGMAPQLSLNGLKHINNQPAKKSIVIPKSTRVKRAARRIKKRLSRFSKLDAICGRCIFKKRKESS